MRRLDHAVDRGVGVLGSPDVYERSRAACGMTKRCGGFFLDQILKTLPSISGSMATSFSSGSASLTVKL
jgi:hypothetical protein